MQNYLKILFVVGAMALAGFGCKTQTAITYLISPDGADGKLKYCNGAEMDSAGYKNTLTKMETVKVAGNLTRESLINKTLNLAAQAAGFSQNPAETEDYVKISGDTAYLKPIEGWAGVSIFMCSWQPFVEKNLEQFKEIKKIEWGR